MLEAAPSRVDPASLAAGERWDEQPAAGGETPISSPLSNEDLAHALDRLADLLQAQQGNPYRVRAYRHAGQTVRALDRPVTGILGAEGRRGLERLPTIGKSIAASIEELVRTGRLRLLDLLEGQVAPEDLFTTIPGIGEALALRIHEALHVETLEELEVAAHDGRLDRVPGFGHRRVQAVRSHLDQVLSHSARRRAWAHHHRQLRLGFDYAAPRPPVATLLAIDGEYRRLAAEDRLERIAPRRFNPEGRAWLPVWHTEREGWQVTAMFSNTARAHDLGKTREWVVIFYGKDGEEDQCTVVTEYRGPLAGRRVVRGREAECRRHHAAQPVAPEVRQWVHEIASAERPGAGSPDAELPAP